MWTALLSCLLVAQGPDPTQAESPAVDPIESLRLEVTVEPKEVLLGDRLEVVVTATHPQSIRLFFPAAPSLAPFRLIGAPKPPQSVVQNGRVVETWRVTVAAMRLGHRKIPPISIDFESADGQTGVVQTPAATTFVAGRIQANESDIAIQSNDPPMAVLDTNWWLILGLIALGIVAITALLTWLAVRYVAGLPKRGPPPPLPRPAHEVAQEKLELLTQEGLLQIGRFKEVAIRLSEILREYLGLRYHKDTLELTSSELLGEMNTLSPQGLSSYRLEQFLQDTDIVKFARHTPTHDQMASDWSACTEIIGTTQQSKEQVVLDRRAEEHRRLLEKPAHPFKRTFAILCDLLFFSILSTLLILAGNAFDMPWLLWADGVLLVAFLLLRDVHGPGSPGKVLTGLTVAPTNDPRSELLPVGARIIRNITLLLPVAGHTMEFVVMAYAADGRRVGDRWAQSRVLDRRPDTSEYSFLLLSCFALVFTVIIGYFVPFHWVVL